MGLMISTAYWSRTIQENTRVEKPPSEKQILSACAQCGARAHVWVFSAAQGIMQGMWCPDGWMAGTGQQTSPPGTAGPALRDRTTWGFVSSCWVGTDPGVPLGGVTALGSHPSKAERRCLGRVSASPQPPGLEEMQTLGVHTSRPEPWLGRVQADERWGPRLRSKQGHPQGRGARSMH